ncbi:MAG: rod-binding protein [Magnetococcales bacterium]|nr:rod-binding protein [Magnetococcales bacterium]
MSSIPVIPPAPPLKRADLPPAISPADQKRLNDATADFESMFIQQLFKSMRHTIPQDPNGGLFAKGQGEKIFEEMLDGEYARNFSRGRSGLGLKEAIFKQTVSRHLSQGLDPKNALDRLQEGENSLNALAQSPIGKEMGAGYGSPESLAKSPPRVKPAGPEIFKEP